jgi:peptide deformylase
LAVVEVLQLGNPILRQKCEVVENPESKEIEHLRHNLEDTLRFCRESTGFGHGIAAPQIGSLKRVVFLNLERPSLLINPEILEMSDEKMIVYDYCLSYPTIFFKVQRSKRVRVSYQEKDGSRKTIEAKGDLSELLQHEIDHLDGILAIDRVIDIKSICTRQEYEKRYKNTSL